MKDLTETEKRFFLISGVIALIIIFMLFPALGNIKKYSRQLTVKKAEYKDMFKLSNQLQQIKLTKITTLSSPPLTYLENKISSLNLSGNLVSIRPTSSDENEIEAKFENLSGNEITKLLYEIQKLPFVTNQLSLKDYEKDNLWTLKIIVKQLN